MRRNHGFSERGRRERGPDLPNRTQDLDSFRQRVPYPSGSEDDFTRHHAELYGEEENLVDGHHTGSAHFPRKSERARMHREYTRSNQPRDRTREAYNDVFNSASAGYQELDREQTQYYDHTSGSLLPRHHEALLPLARAREYPNHQ